jgi:hypothetical protein
VDIEAKNIDLGKMLSLANLPPSAVEALKDALFIDIFQLYFCPPAPPPGFCKPIFDYSLLVLDSTILNSY